MKLHPLILTTSDVQALIEGRKTRHSVLVKSQHIPVRDEVIDGKRLMRPSGWPLLFEEEFMSRFSPFGSPGDSEWQTGTPPEDGMYWVEGIGTPMKYVDRRCPLPYQSRWKRMGSILYLREAWRLRGWDFEEGTMLVEYATGEKKNCRCYDPTEDSGWLMNQVEKLMEGGYLKTDPKDKERFVFTDKKQPFNSPLSMPREASRIYLENIGQIYKRVQDITEEEAKAEGMIVTPEQALSNEYHRARLGDKIPAGDHQLAYANYWNHRYFTSISDQLKGNSAWDKNQWVFSCNWKVLSTTGKPSYL